jgi:ABC-type dipeptide/oligopeptide/nickel transport system permease component
VKKLQHQKEPVTEVLSSKKEKIKLGTYSPLMKNLITWELTLLVLMAGTVYGTLKNIGPFSIWLIFAFLLCFTVNLVLTIYSLVNNNEKTAKIALYGFVVLIAIWAFFATTFLISTFKVKFIMQPIYSNITGQ